MPKLVYTPEQTQEIVRRYLAGDPAEKIARDAPFGILTNATTVKNYLKRSGITLRNQLIADDVRQRVAEISRTGVPAYAVAAQCGVSKSFVDKVAREDDIYRRRGREKTCFVDETVFDTLTPESLYFSGFLWADGCISHETYSTKLILVVAERDRAHLEKYKAFLKSTYSITIQKPSKTAWGGPAVRHGVNSKRLCAALEAHGFTTKRTRTPSPDLAKSPSFWRGALDGDGWLGTTIQYGKYIYPYVGLSGQHNLLEMFQNFLNENGLAKLEIVPTESGIWKMITSGSTAEAIIRTLYKDNTIALDRKNWRAQEIIAGRLDKFPPYIEGPSARRYDAENDEVLAEVL